MADECNPLLAVMAEIYRRSPDALLNWKVEDMFAIPAVGDRVHATLHTERPFLLDEDDIWLWGESARVAKALICQELQGKADRLNAANVTALPLAEDTLNMASAQLTTDYAAIGAALEPHLEDILPVLVTARQRCAAGLSSEPSLAPEQSRQAEPTQSSEP